MPDISIDPIAAIVTGVIAWASREKPDTERKIKRRSKAILTVLEAAIKTKSYIYDRDVLAESNRKQERSLASSWKKASNAIQSYDQDLFMISQVKSLGWSDPREWAEGMDKVATVNLDKIIEQCNFLLQQ